MANTPVYANLTQKQRRLLSDLSLSNEYVFEFVIPGELNKYLISEKYITDEFDDGNELNRSSFLSLLCSDISLPGSTFATAEVKDNYLGVTQEFAHTRLYTDIDATFYVDKRYRILELFQGWMDFISGGSGDKVSQNEAVEGFYRRFRFPSFYKTTLRIAKLERDYNPKGNFFSRTYNLINSFPKSISAIPVSYGPADILKITVTFSYDRYTIEREGIGTSNKPGKNSPQPSASTSLGTNTTSGRPSSNAGRIGTLRVKQAKGNITPAEERELRGLTNP